MSSSVAIYLETYNLLIETVFWAFTGFRRGIFEQDLQNILWIRVRSFLEYFSGESKPCAIFTSEEISKVIVNVVFQNFKFANLEYSLENSEVVLSHGHKIGINIFQGDVPLPLYPISWLCTENYSITLHLIRIDGKDVFWSSSNFITQSSIIADHNLIILFDKPVIRFRFLVLRVCFNNSPHSNSYQCMCIIHFDF